ncbi:MAG TPA: hypothetical protein VMS17_14890 [Gemmataceae bacterium]|nr:hypothetical protein [Gemmataceae bacterium]
MHRTQTIKFEGKLLGPWVDEVSKVCAADADPSSRMNLVLSALTFVAAAGELLLRDLIARGVEVVACSSYVAENLVQEAYLQAYKHFDGFHGESGRPWLLAVVGKTCRTWPKRNRAGRKV